jgi:tripartite-type tricarboxylate transporter receptor subunit TctC
VAPEVPADRVAALRQAFMKVQADKEFQADAQKANLGLTPLNGQELTDLVNQILAIPPDQAAKLKDVLK